MKKQKRVLSGIRATGRLHLGNYLGAVKGMLALQEDPEFETLYMVADAHTVTTPYDVSELQKNRREVIIDYLAAGLDPKKSIIFQQAEVAQHFELTFYFSSVTTVAKMRHLPTFKDKIKQHPDNVTMALLNYPVLMAADILIYKANKVPVGIDQEPHLEVAREVARKMNEVYGTDFPEPTRFATKGEYVPSLKGEGKMSKSVEGSFINLMDDLKTIKKRLAGAPTDSGKGKIVYKPLPDFAKRSDTAEDHFMEEIQMCYDQSGAESQGVVNLLKFVELFEGMDKRRQYEKQYHSTGLRYGDVKAELAEAIYAELQPLQEKRKELEANPKYVDQVIEEGAEKARKIAQQTVDDVKEKMGLN